MSDRGIVEGPPFTEGDTDCDRDYTIEQSRAAFDLTGYSPPVLYAHATTADVDDPAPIPGSILSPATGGVVRFDHTSIAAHAGEYLCQVELVHPTNGTRRLKRKIRIVVDEAVEALT